MGVGSTLIAAKQLGRKTVGIELEREMVSDAIRRLEAAAFLFFLSAWLFRRYSGYYEMSRGYTLNNLAICYLLFYFVRNPLSAGGRNLNWAPVAHIGVLSYSLYLWQQMFLGQYARHPAIWCRLRSILR